MSSAPARKIIHLDLDAFFCAVEELLDPALNGKPFAVGGSPTGRGVVTSASYAARKFGVRSAMPMAKAIKLCPQLIRVASTYSNYTDKSKEVRKIMKSFTPRIQPISIDEAFLDFTDFEESGEYYAIKLQEEIQNKARLPCSLGVATNKLVAKIATNVGKAANPTDTYPNAILIVPPGQEAEFLAPLPTNALWGVGPKTAESLEKFGIYTIGELASYPVDKLSKRYGKTGVSLNRRAQGIDFGSVSDKHEAKSVSQETTFPRDVSDEQILKDKILSHSKSISRRLQKAKLIGITIKLKLRWSNFTTLSRQVTLPTPTHDAEVIYKAASGLLKKHRKPQKAVRLIGVGVTNFQEAPKQMSLWDSPKNEEKNKLIITIEELQRRFGVHTIQMGSAEKSELQKSRL